MQQTAAAAQRLVLLRRLLSCCRWPALAFPCHPGKVETAPAGRQACPATIAAGPLPPPLLPERTSPPVPLVCRLVDAMTVPTQQAVDRQPGSGHPGPRCGGCLLQVRAPSLLLGGPPAARLWLWCVPPPRLRPQALLLPQPVPSQPPCAGRHHDTHNAEHRRESLLLVPTVCRPKHRFGPASRITCAQSLHASPFTDLVAPHRPSHHPISSQAPPAARWVQTGPPAPTAVLVLTRGPAYPPPAVEFEDRRDAEDAVRSMNGKHGWRVEFARAADKRSGGGGFGGGGFGGGGPYRRGRSPSPRRRGSPSPRRARRSPSYDGAARRRTSSRSRSRDRRLSPPRSREHSLSPPGRSRSLPPRRARSPLPRRSRRSPSPAHRHSPSPARRRSLSPARRRSPSPARRRSPTPAHHRRSPSPAYRRSPSPAHRRSASPPLRRSRSGSPMED